MQQKDTKNMRRLLLYGTLSSILYGFFTLTMVHLGTPKLPPNDPVRIAIFAVVYLSSFILYILTLKNVVQRHLHRNEKKLLLFFSVLFALLLMILPPIGSADSYVYASRARVFTEYQQNPYITTTSSFPSDLFFTIAPQEWNTLPMNYGPLWTFISIGISALAKNNISLHIFFYQLLGACSLAILLFCVWKILRRIAPTSAFIGVLLLAWNPLVLFESVNNAHNDIVMMMFFSLALLFLMQEKFFLAFFFLFLSVLIKYITLLALPFCMIAMLKKKKGMQGRLLSASGMLLLGAALTFLFYAPFWEGIRTFEGLFEQAHFFFILQLSFLPILLFGGISIISSLMHGISIPVWTESFIRNISIGTYLIFYCILLLKAKQNRHVLQWITLAIVLYLFTAVFFLQPWYLLFPFLMMALLPSSKTRSILYILTGAGICSYIIGQFMSISMLFAGLLISIFLIHASKKHHSRFRDITL